MVSETLDIAVSMALQGLPVMLCIVDTAGQAQCHHQKASLPVAKASLMERYVLVEAALSSCQDASHVSLVLSQPLLMLLGCYCLNSTPSV